MSFWPNAAVAARQQFGRYRGTSGHRSDIVDLSLLTPNGDLEERLFYRACASPRFYTAKTPCGHRGRSSRTAPLVPDFECSQEAFWFVPGALARPLRRYTPAEITVIAIQSIAEGRSPSTLYSQ